MFDALKSLDLTALPEKVQTAIRAAQHEALNVAMQSANLKRSAVRRTSILLRPCGGTIHKV
jgi:hypothetical protein